MNRLNGVLAKTLLLFLIVVLVISGCGKKEAAIEFSVDIPPELLIDYDEYLSEEIFDVPVIKNVIPFEGRIGTEIVIQGNNFGISNTNSIATIEGNPLEIISWSSTEIICRIPFKTKSGVIEVTTNGGKAEGGKFNVLEEKHEPLASEEIHKDKDNIVRTNKGISVALPNGSVDTDDNLSISLVENGPVFNSAMFREGQMYSIELDKTKKLVKPAVIEFQLNKDEDPRNTLVYYFHEKSSSWVLAPTVINTDKGKIAVVTEHFSHWLIVHARAGGTFLSDDYFVIAYNPGDNINVPGLSTIDELAVVVSEYLKEAYTAYYNYLGEEYVTKLSKRTDMDYLDRFAQSPGGQLLTDFTKLEQTDLYALTDALGIRNRVIVELSSKHNSYGASAGPSLKWARNSLFLPTNYKDDNYLKSTVAHELFHNIQANTFFSLEMNMKDFYQNKWLIEATAEYASWGIAFPEARPEMLHLNTQPNRPYNFFSNTENGHEYGMSFFVEYVIKRGDKNFKTLYKYMTDSRPNIGKALENYVKDKLGTTIGMAYFEFWQDLFTTKDMPKYVKLPYNIRPRPIRNSTEDIERGRPIAPGTVGGFFTYPQFPDHCETLVVCFSPPGGKMPAGTSVVITKMENFVVNELDTIDQDPFQERQGNRAKWVMMTESDVIGHHYVTFEKSGFSGDIRQVALMVFDAFTKHDPIKMDMNFIHMDVTPKNIDKIQVGKEITFSVNLSNVFPQAKTMDLVWDFGDGNNHSEKFSQNSPTLKSSVKHKYSKEGNYNLTVSLYDTSNGRHLIAERIYKLGQGESLEISKEPKEPSTRDEVTLKVKGKPGWAYVWEFGDGQKRNGLGLTEVKYQYKSQGTYDVKVIAYEDNTMKKVVGIGALALKVDDKLMELQILPSSNLEANAGSFVEISVDSTDKAHPIERYRIHWNTEGASERTMEANRLVIKYNIPGRYNLEARALDQNGNTIGTGKGVIEIVQGAEDPYKKYDSGFFQFDYGKLYYEEREKGVEYKDIETKRYEGMIITFYDTERTKPQFVEYRLEGKFVGRDSYNEDGTPKSYMYQYTKEGIQYNDLWEYENGLLIRETHSKDSKYHGKQLLVNPFHGDRTKGVITQVEYLDGKKHGLEKISHEQADIGKEPAFWASIIEYKDGEYHGSFQTFFPDGTPKDIITYVEGKQDGESKQYRKADDGTIYLFREAKYDKGNAISMLDYNFIAGKARISHEHYYESGISKSYKFYNYKPNGILMTMTEEIYDEKGNRIKRIRYEYRDDGSLKGTYTN